MKKIIIIFAFGIMLSSCSNISKKQDFTVTINCADGSSSTVYKIDEESKQIINSSARNNDTGVTTFKDYTYNENNELRSVSVYDTQGEAYRMIYGDFKSNSERSVVPEIAESPSETRKITKVITSSRASNTEDTTSFEEIYRDENGNITGILHCDENGNVYTKSSEEDANNE